MSRTQFLEAAKKALEGQDPDTACKHMSSLVNQGGALSAEERGVLFAAYKNATGKRRAEISKNPGNAAAKTELANTCADAINVFQAAVPNASDHESKVFFYKALGDFYRYYDEVQPNQQNKEAALQCYKTATEWATDGLQPTNPLRLNVALNFGVYYQETIQDPAQGLKVTTDAIDAARPVLAKLTNEQEKQEASFVLQLLFDNAKLWSADLGKPEPQPIQGLSAPPQQQGGPQQGGRGPAPPGYSNPQGGPPQGYGPPGGYPQQGPPGGYPYGAPPQGYGPQGGFPQQGGYPAPGGYPGGFPQGGFPPQGGYPGYR